MSDVDDAVRFSIEDIKTSVEALDTDEEYIAALCKIENWCKNAWLDRIEEIRNAGGRVK